MMMTDLTDAQRAAMALNTICVGAAVQAAGQLLTAKAQVFEKALLHEAMRQHALQKIERATQS